MDSLLRDLRHALRWIARSPGFAAVAILSLGLGVGVNTAMFSVVDAVLLRPLPVSSPETLVDVFTTGGDGDVHATSSYPDVQDLRDRSTVFSDVTAFSPMFAAARWGDASRLLIGHIVTGNHFQMLGVRPLHGRLLAPDDDAPGAARVVVLSHRTWMREFGGDVTAVGGVMHLRGLPYTIVGVAPPEFTGVVPLLVPELWLPMAHEAEVEPAGINDAVPGPGSTRLERRGARWLFVKGRLRPGVTAEQAHANVRVVASQLAMEYPQTNRDRAMSAVPTSDVRLLVPEATGPASMAGGALMAVVLLVLLIACANVAGLLLSRAAARRREMSVRLAIGASRGRLVRQLLVEGLVLGGAGVVVAVGVAWAAVQAVLATELPIPAVLPLDLRLDGRVLLFAAVAAGLAGIGASLVPAWRASSPSLVTDLRGGESAVTRSAGRRRFTLGETLVASQVALAVVLLVVASLLLRSFGATREADLGIDVRGVAAVSFDTDMVRYERDRGVAFWRQAIDRVRALPGVEAVALASPRIPLDVNFTTSEFHVEGRAYGDGQRGEILNTVQVTPEYFDVLRVPARQGRTFAETDREGAGWVAIVNEAFVRRYWPDGPGVGRRIRLVSARRDYEVVGVVADYKVRSVTETPTPYVHLAAWQRPATYNYLIARTGGDGGALVESMRRELGAMEPGLVFLGNGTMAQTLAVSLLPARLSAALATAFGALGALLAAIGLYGVMAFLVGRRTREIGIRLALGADPSAVFVMILRRAAVVTGVGAVAGLLLAAGAARVLAGVLYGPGAADMTAWTLALVVMAGAATLASVLPAARAMRVDPVRQLTDGH